MKRFFWITVGIILAACGGDDLPRKSEVNGVRILAARTETPYAAPGDIVNVEALAFDGRTAPPRDPMRVSWFPAPCIEPAGKQYYDCYAALEAAFPEVGVDITPRLSGGTKTTITIPPDALAQAASVAGGREEPSVTAYAFVMACAGHIERVVPDGHLAANAPPFACFDADHRQLGTVDEVFGFTRIAIFASRKNAPPTFTSVRIKDGPIDPAKGINIPHCDISFIDSIFSPSCRTWNMDVVFDDAQAEVDPDNVDANGKQGRETIYTDWFTTIGHLDFDRRIAFDPFSGRPGDDDVSIEPPESPGKGTMFVVLHDNRGGTSWVTFPVTVE